MKYVCDYCGKTWHSPLTIDKMIKISRHRQDCKAKHQEKKALLAQIYKK